MIKKKGLLLIMQIAAIMLLIGWSVSAPPNVNAQICCNTFGYGSLMEKCCHRYAWSAADECDKEWKGGGSEIVDDSFCDISYFTFHLNEGWNLVSAPFEVRL